MKAVYRTVFILLVSIALCPPAVAGDRDLQTTLATGDIESLRINLNPWGPHLGFELEIEGDNPALEPLLSLISNAEPSQGHKCANRGAIRIHLMEGEVVAVGLLPSHSEGTYQFRLYDGDRLEGVFSVGRDDLLDALEGLGVPVDDPTFSH